MRHPAPIQLSRDHRHALRMAQRPSRAAEVADHAAMQEEALAALFAAESGGHFREEEEIEERALFEAIQHEVEPSRVDEASDAGSPRAHRSAAVSEPAEGAGPGALIRAEQAELVPLLEDLAPAQAAALLACRPQTAAASHHHER